MGQEQDDWLAGFGFDVSKYSSVVSDAVQVNADMAKVEAAAVVSTATGAAAGLASAVGAETTATNLRDVQSTADAEAKTYVRFAEMQAGDAAAQFGVVLPGQENNPVVIGMHAEQAGTDLPPLPVPDPETIHGTGEAGEESEDE